MAREQDFINKLSDFTKSLEDLVDILKEQQKSGPTEVLNKLVETLDANDIAKIASDVSIIKKNTIDIKSNTEKTLKAIESLKSKKEKGVFDDVGKDNKNSILDGVKTVILIAGAVLAIGMAFKMVGNVDLLSVLALGTGIYFVATAFAKVASITDDKGKPIDFKRALMVSGILILMSSAILIAGLILKQIPVLTIFELITIVGVGASMGLATYFLLKAVGNLDKKDIALAALLPVFVPLVAIAIVTAAFILSDIKPLSIEQIGSAIGVSIALVPIMVGVGYMIRGLKDATPKDILMLTSVIPAISLSIVLSSIILMATQDIPLGNVLKASTGIFLASLALTPTIYLLQKGGFLSQQGIVNLLWGAAAILIISATVVAASYILGMGKYDKYPTLEWSLGVGLSMIGFGTAMIGLGSIIFLTGPIGLAYLAAGALGVLMVASTIVATSYILAQGKYDKYPTLDWSLGVGLSMIGFGTAVLTLGGIILGSFGMGMVAISAGAIGVTMIAQSIVDASHILAKGNWTKGNYPSIEWAIGVGSAIVAFSSVLISLQNSKSIFDSIFGTEIDLPKFIEAVSSAIITAGIKFSANKGSFDGGYPSEDWAKGVGGSIVAFATAIAALKSAGVDIDADDLNDDDGAVAIMNGLADGIIQIGRKFDNNTDVKFDKNKVPGQEWITSITNSLELFSKGAKVISDNTSWFTDIEDIQSNLLGIVDIIIKLDSRFNKPNLFNKDNVPGQEWIDSISNIIKIFENEIDSSNIISLDNLSKSLLIFSIRMSLIKDKYSEAFKDDTVSLITKSIVDIVKALPKQTEIDPLWSLVEALTALSTIPWDNLINIEQVSRSIGYLSNQISKLDTQKAEMLSKIGRGLHIISVVDNEKLKKTLETLKEKDSELKILMNDKGWINSFLTNGNNQQSNNNNINKSDKKEDVDLSKYEKEMLAYIKNMDNNISKMAGITQTEAEEKLQAKNVDDKGNSSFGVNLFKNGK